MKKIFAVSIVVAIAVFCIAQTASADKCEYYQWKPLYCKGAAPTPAPVRAPSISKGEQIVLEGVYFDTGSAKIKPASYSALDANVSKIKNSHNDLKIWVVGYTDDRGSDAMNQKLSERRAESVKNYFVTKGISESRIYAEGRGESHPVSSNATEDGRAQNRRIELEAK
jgi:OOP family OmpA-OmpF porin